MGQPTHFLPGRQWGMFIVPAPKDFKPADSYTWTIVANGQSTSIPLRLHPDYVMSPFTEIAVGNTPPVLRFEPNGKAHPGSARQPRHRADDAPRRSRRRCRCTLWASDDMKYTSGTNAPPAGSRPPVVGCAGRNIAGRAR